MRRTLRVAIALLVMAGCATTGPSIEHHTLDNGLQVYLLEDRSAPIVTFQYWVNVGSADETEEEPGITGLSHFFEHLMFRGTKRYPDYFKAVGARGGKLNAFTWVDVTTYWEKLPSSELDFILDIESDRLKNMTLDFVSVESEREVVKSERRLRVDGSPSGRLYEAMAEASYQKHGYRWSTVGWMDDLNHITLEQVRAYHAKHYTAGNSFIVLVGDFDSAKALERIADKFKDIPPGPAPASERPVEPEQTSQRRTFVVHPSENGMFHVAFRGPAGAHSDFVTMEVIAALMSGGPTSRLHRALVEGEKPLAGSVSGFVFPFVDPSPYEVEVNMLPNRSNRLAEERVLAEFERLRSEPIGGDELKRAVAKLRGDLVRGLTTTQDRAQAIGFAVRATGDPRHPWQRLEAYGTVTPADIQRVADRWLRPERAVIGHLVNGKKLVDLAKRFVKEFPTTVEADELTLRSIELRGEFAELASKGESLRSESLAIDWLRQRAAAEKTRLGGNPEAVETINQHMAKAATGAQERARALKARQAERDARLTAHLGAKIDQALRTDRYHRSAAGPGQSATARLTFESLIAEHKQAGEDFAGRPLASQLLSLFQSVLGDDAPRTWAIAQSSPLAAEVSDFAHQVRRVGVRRHKGNAEAGK